MARTVEPADDMKTAVVMIHGIGEQWPMDTLRNFVDAAWTEDPTLRPPGEHQIYSKPDTITGNFELRRITTRPWVAPDRRRADFVEFYWAHLMQDNSLGAVLGWLKRLLFRSPARVPKRLFWGWFVGLILFVCAGILAALSRLQPDWLPFAVPAFVWSAIALAGAAFSALWLRPAAGDAARYLSPAPGNVGARQAIREAGVDLLQKLQAAGEYDRIIVVGHSLGTVIGYDVLNHAWGRVDPKAMFDAHRENDALMASLTALEKAAVKLNKSAAGADLVAWRTAQRAYCAELAKARDAAGRPLWLVSDFVTLGSPLCNADVLLARDADELSERALLRELPTNPPTFERAGKAPFTYPSASDVRIPHHGAVFAPVVWTNIYFPNILGVIGDFISGVIVPRFGLGIRNVRIPIGRPWFRHLSYWTNPKGDMPAIRALRRALNFRLRDEAALWGAQEEANPVPAEALSFECAPPPVVAPPAAALPAAGAHAPGTGKGE